MPYSENPPFINEEVQPEDVDIQENEIQDAEYIQQAEIGVEEGDNNSSSSSLIKTKWRKSFQKVRMGNMVSSQFRTLRDMYPDVMMDEEKLKIQKKLGDGQFGQVLRCSYNDEIIAVKLLKAHLRDTSEETTFLEELNILKKLRHPNIVRYKGTGIMNIDGQQQVFLAQACLEGGSLKNLLLQQGVQCGKRVYSVWEAYQWMLDVGNGMQYLHNAHPKVIHRDLKPDNILIKNNKGERRRAIIADFGLHTLVHPHHELNQEGYELTGETGSYIYMAPEVFQNKPYTEKVDVYSFGVIMWEVFSYQMVVARITMSGSIQEAVNYAKGCSFGARQHIPQSWPKPLSHLISNCWHTNPDARPTFDKVVTQLECMQTEIQEWQIHTQVKKGCCSVM